jgi:hypothetical protein
LNAAARQTVATDSRSVVRALDVMQLLLKLLNRRVGHQSRELRVLLTADIPLLALYMHLHLQFFK